MKQLGSPEWKDSLHDLFFFCGHYYGLDLEEKPHREMCAAIQAGELETSTPYTMLTVPRGCYKSSIARAALVWKQLRQIYLFSNVYHRIVIASATLALGRAALASIAGVMKAGGIGERITKDFGPLWQNKTKEKPSSKVEDGIILKPRIDAGEIATVIEPSVFVGSLRRISTGFHADECLVDDINNRENVRTDHQRLETQAYWRLLFPILGTNDRAGRPVRITFLNTPWHDDDVRGMIIREEQALQQADSNYVCPWTFIHRSGINPDGTAYFPTKYPLARLDYLKMRMTVSEFSANYLCDPLGNFSFVDEHLIRFVNPETFPGLMKGRITLDPAFHKEAAEAGCYSAIIVAAFDRWAKMHVLDARGSREWSARQLINELFAVQAEYPDFPIFIEDIHTSFFEHAIRLEEAERTRAAGHPVRLRVNWVPVDVNLTKYERYSKLEPRFRSGNVVFSNLIAPAIQAEIKNELVRGPVARFKDFLDALAMADIGVRPRNRGGDAIPMTVPPRERSSTPTFNDVFGLEN